MATKRVVVISSPVTSLFVMSLLMTSSLAVRVEITSPQQPVKVFKGTSLQLVCEVTDVTDYEISSGQLIWGRILASIETMKNDGINYIIENVTTNQEVRSSLTITYVKYTDDASYFCSWRQASQTTDYIAVRVKGRPEITSVELDGEPIAGQNLMITCTVQGMPLPTVEWTRPFSSSLTSSASSVSLSTREFNNNTYTKISRLTLVNVTSQDVATYRCSAENDYGTDQRNYWMELYSWATISTIPGGGRNVTSEPIFTALTRLNLYCAGYNIPNDVNLQIHWSFRAEGNQKFAALRNSDRMTMSRLADAPLTTTYDYYYVTSRLAMTEADFTDQGTVRCQVFEGGVLVTSAERDLRVHDVPRVTLIPKRVGVAIGDDVEVTCRVEARPNATSYSWLKDYAIPLVFTGRQVNDYTAELKYRLQIRSDVDYNSIYTCRASNTLGTQQYDLTVEEKDNCDGTVCTGPHEYCMDTGDSYYCLCKSGYYWDSASGSCLAFATPSPTPVLTSISTRASVSTPATTAATSTTPKPGGGDGGSSNQVAIYAGVGAGVIVVVIIIAVVIIVVMRRRDQGTTGSEPKPETTAPTPLPPPSQRPLSASTYYSNTAFSPFSDPHDYTPLKLDRSEFPRERLQLQEKLGQGKFGTVVRALALSLFSNGKWDTVAVKMHKEVATDAEKSEFFRELSLLRSLPRHQNVVSFVGCCTLSDPTYIIMEYCANGDLLSYLRKRRPDRGMFVGHDTNDLTARDFFSFALHVARGMAHVADHKIVHRDVAARNILLSDRNVCKVSDFGLARRVDDNSDVYEIVSRRPLPLRWMSPESLRDGVHTSQSDVWSYGILLWELVTLGSSPYPGNTGKAVIDLVTSGTRPEIPPQCRGELADLMSSCWAMAPEMRPTFDVITVRFEKLLEQEGDYLQLDNIKEGIYSILEPSVSGERV